jgi:sigma-B regulation protein RsbU (phosphoserine phosphatase)
VASELENLKQENERLRHELSEREQQLRVYQADMASLNERLGILAEQLEKQLEVTKVIQGKLTPKEYPNISGFEFSSKYVPGMKSGGDYFDVFESSSKLRFGVILATCSGYSVSALLLTVILKYHETIRSGKLPDPESMLEFIGQELLPSLSDDDQVSLIYGVVDKRTYTFNYSAMGKVHSFVKRSSGGDKDLEVLDVEKDPLTKESIDLGEYPVKSVPLGKGDSIIIVSNGMVAQMDEGGHTFGRDRLIESLKASHTTVHDQRNELMFQFENHKGERFVDYDTTAFVMQVGDKVIKLA